MGLIRRIAERRSNELLINQLEELDHKALEWHKKVESATGEAKQKMQQELETLKDKRKDIARDLEKLKDASSEALSALNFGPPPPAG